LTRETLNWKNQRQKRLPIRSPQLSNTCTPSVLFTETSNLRIF
jgi:hypothetical protein